MCSRNVCADLVTAADTGLSHPRQLPGDQPTLLLLLMHSGSCTALPLGMSCSLFIARRSLDQPPKLSLEPTAAAVLLQRTSLLSNAQPFFLASFTCAGLMAHLQRPRQSTGQQHHLEVLLVCLLHLQPRHHGLISAAHALRTQQDRRAGGHADHGAGGTVQRLHHLPHYLSSIHNRPGLI